MNAWIGGKGTAPAEERDTTGSNPVLLRNHSRMKGCEGWGEAVKAEREWRRISKNILEVKEQNYITLINKN